MSHCSWVSGKLPMWAAAIINRAGKCIELGYQMFSHTSHELTGWALDKDEGLWELLVCWVVRLCTSSQVSWCDVH